MSKNPTNPFYNGVERAMRESNNVDNSPTQEQQHRAINNALIAFGAAASAQEKKKGFWSNFADIGRAGLPAM